MQWLDEGWRLVQMSCPFLNEKDQVCMAIHWGKKVGASKELHYRPLLKSEIEKCKTMSKRCPDRLAMMD